MKTKKNDHAVQNKKILFDLNISIEVPLEIKRLQQRWLWQKEKKISFIAAYYEKKTLGWHNFWVLRMFQTTWTLK